MAMRRVYEVAPKGDLWTLRERGGGAPTAYPNKAFAVEAGRRIANLNKPSQLIIKKADGTIETEHTYGSDPFPPRG